MTLSSVSSSAESCQLCRMLFAAHRNLCPLLASILLRAMYMLVRSGVEAKQPPELQTSTQLYGCDAQSNMLAAVPCSPLLF